MDLQTLLCQDFQIADFMEPDSAYFPVYSWIWNDLLSKEQIINQLKDFKNQNIQNIYIIPISKEFRPQTMPSGLVPHYLHDDYLEMFHFAVHQGKARGLRFWLYDEDGWPSASCCGEVVRTLPQLKQKQLASKTICLAANEVFTGTGKGFLAAFCGKNRLSLPYCSKKKTHVTVYFFEEIHPYHNPYPDILDARTADLFLSLTHEKYAEKFGDCFTDDLPCVFTDEPNLAKTPWTPRLDEKFYDKFHYDIKDFLPALLDETLTEKKDVQARIDYRTMVSQLLVNNFYSKIKEWCQKHGCLFTGHADGDDSIFTHYQNGHLLKVLRKMDIPGVDVILRQIFPAKEQEISLAFDDNYFTKRTAENSFFPRMASSAANQTETKLALSESFAVYGSGLTFEQMRYIIHFQAVRGINVFNIMNVTYSSKTNRLAGLRPNFCKNQPGFDNVANFNQYLARLSYLLTLGKPDIKTALYFPIADIWSGGEYAKAAGKNYERLGAALEKQNINFDVIDDELILNAPLADTIHAGFSDYQTVIVPKSGFTPANVLNKLRAFAENGVNVVWSDGSADVSSVNYKNTPIFSGSANIKYIHRILDQGSLYFLYNEGLQPETATIQFFEKLPMFELNLTDGEIYTAPSASTQVHLNSGEGTAFLFSSKSFPAQSRKPQICEYTRQISIDEFDVCMLKQFILTPENLTVQVPNTVWHKISVSKQQIPVKKSFSGVILYESQFELNDRTDAKDIFVDLGELCYSCEVFLNGQRLGARFAPPYVLYAKADILQIKNKLQIRVANTLANQFVFSDALDKEDFRSIGTYHFIEKEFEKENCDIGLKNTVKIYY